MPDSVTDVEEISRVDAGLLQKRHSQSNCQQKLAELGSIEFRGKITVFLGLLYSLDEKLLDGSVDPFRDFTNFCVLKSKFRSAVKKKTTRTGCRPTLLFMRRSKQVSEALDCRLFAMERFSSVNQSFVCIQSEDGEEEVSLVTEGAIDAAFPQACDAHQVIEGSRRIPVAPELIPHCCEYLVLIELSWPTHVGIMQY